MKHKIKFLVLLSLCLLSACSSDDATEIPISGDAKPVYLNISFGAQTYAQAADPQEKEVRSVAFFIQTTQGGFYKFLSGDNQLSEALSGTSGRYNATIKIDAPDYSGTTKVWAIGNYKENGLESTLRSITNLNELKAVQSIALTAETDKPQCPLILSGSKDVNLMQTTSVQIQLKRMVARIDVESQSTSFELISALMYNPKSKGYVLPGNTPANIATIGLLSRFAPVQASDPKNIRGLYCFETNGLESQTPVITVVGKHNSFEKVLNITLKSSGGNAIIKPNGYYHLRVKEENGKIVFSFDISDWDEDDDGGELGAG